MRHRKPTPQVLELIERIRIAFAEVVLGDGIGLHQAEAMDDHATTEFTLRKLRSGEEAQNWSRLNVKELNKYSSALSFFDAAGMRFHLPAYLIAELNKTLTVDLMFYLICVNDDDKDRFSLLTAEQRSVVAEYLKYCLTDASDYIRPMIENALAQSWSFERQ